MWEYKFLTKSVIFFFFFFQVIYLFYCISLCYYYCYYFKLFYQYCHDFILLFIYFYVFIFCLKLSGNTQIWIGELWTSDLLYAIPSVFHLFFSSIIDIGLKCIFLHLFPVAIKKKSLSFFPFWVICFILFLLIYYYYYYLLSLLMLF